MLFPRLALAAVIAAAVSAQTPAAPPPKPAPPPEVAAYNKAIAEKDPLKKIEALESWLKEFDSPPLSANVRLQLVAAVIKASPNDAAKIGAAVTRQIKETPAVRQPGLLISTVNLLAGESLHLDLARGYARSAIDKLNYEAFAKDAADSAAKAKRPAPRDEDLRRQFFSQLASAWQALGQVELKANRYTAAERAYLRAIQINPEVKNGVASQLASIYEKRHKTAKAFEYATLARLGRPNRETRETFERLFPKAVRNAAKVDVEDYLDAQYKRLFPPPLHLERYQKTPKRTSRIVLAEVHTGAGCGPCVAADLAFDAHIERYSRDELIVLMYHQHIPRPDPMTNDETRGRWKFIESRGVPTFIIDGQNQSGGGTREMTAQTEKRIRALIEPRLEIAPGAALDIRAAADGRKVLVQARVDAVAKPAAPLKLRLALVEKLIRYSGENGIRFHPMVVRSLVSLDVKPGQSVAHGFDLDAVAARLKDHITRFETKDERHNPDGKFRFMEYPLAINSTNLAIVAYVEDEKSREVLQAAQSDIAGLTVSRRASE